MNEHEQGQGMNGETERFIMQAQAQNHAWSLQNGGADEPTYGRWSQGKCAAGGCGSELNIVRVERSDDQTIYFFACGHRFVARDLFAVEECRAAFQAAAVAPTTEGQTVQARRGGFTENTKAHEFSMVQTFAALFRPELIMFDKARINSDVVENTPIDIVAESEDGTVRELFQVTRLYDSQLWQQVNVTDSADLVIKYEDLCAY